MSEYDYGFNQYQESVGETAIYPDANTGSAAALAYVGLGLGEAGEIQGKIKKILRDNDGVVTVEARREIAKEAGDLMWYLARLCSELGAGMGEVARGNIDKLKSRQERGVLKGNGDNR